MRTVIISLYLLMQTIIVFAQNDLRFRKQVLQKGIIGKECTLIHPDKNQSKVTYLGSFKNKKGRIIKIATYTYLFGLEGDLSRASSQILFYNGANQYLGDYAVGDIPSLPDKFVNGKLIFLPSASCSQTTKIDFRYGIPKQIFILCNGDKGNISSFVSIDIK